MPSLGVDVQLCSHAMTFEFGIIKGSKNCPVRIVMGNGNKCWSRLGIDLHQWVKS